MNLKQLIEEARKELKEGIERVKDLPSIPIDKKNALTESLSLLAFDHAEVLMVRACKEMAKEIMPEKIEKLEETPYGVSEKDLIVAGTSEIILNQLQQNIDNFINS